MSQEDLASRAPTGAEELVVWWPEAEPSPGSHHPSRATMSMTNIETALAPILGRRSIRVYEDREVPGELVDALLRAAMAAPSAVARDPWRFVVLRSKAVRADMARGLPNGGMLASAGVGFAICGELEAAHDRQLSYLLQDCSAAIENMLLAAHALGLGAVWLGVHPREARIAHVRGVLALPASVLPISCIAVGFPAERKPARTRYDSAWVHYDRW
jgi:nitroreductase